MIFHGILVVSDSQLQLLYTTQYTSCALQIIDPRYGYRDAAFPPQINEQLPSVEYQVSVSVSASDIAFTD